MGKILKKPVKNVIIFWCINRIVVILYTLHFSVYSKLSTLTFIAFISKIKIINVIHIHTAWKFYEIYINDRQYQLLRVPTIKFDRH